MTKHNPNRQELLEFINEITSELGINSKKIEDLSSGVQYLHLLHQIHPQVVKISKVNLKASQQYEFVSNLRLLATYLNDIKAPFTFDVQKMSQRNYQENLSLLKNLHKLYYFTKENKDTSRDQNSRKTSSLLELKLESKNDAEKRKIAPKAVIKAPKIPNKPQKHDIQNSGFQGMMIDAKKNADQIKSIMIVVKGEEKVDESEIAAKQKLAKICQILGLKSPDSIKKEKKETKKKEIAASTRIAQEQRFSTNQSFDLESKTDKKNNPESISEKENKLDKINEKITEVPECQKKSKKSFDCEEVKQKALKMYQLRPQSAQRITRISGQNLLNYENEDPKYIENLLSPQVKTEQQKKISVSLRKSALIIRQSSSEANSLERSQRQSLKKVRFEGQKSSEKKELSSVKQNEKQNDSIQRVSSAVKSSDRVLRSSKEKEKKSEEYEIIMD